MSLPYLTLDLIYAHASLPPAFVPKHASRRNRLQTSVAEDWGRNGVSGPKKVFAFARRPPCVNKRPSRPSVTTNKPKPVCAHWLGTSVTVAGSRGRQTKPNTKSCVYVPATEVSLLSGPKETLCRCRYPKHLTSTRPTYIPLAAPPASLLPPASVPKRFKTAAIREQTAKACGCRLGAKRRLGAEEDWSASLSAATPENYRKYLSSARACRDSATEVSVLSYGKAMSRI
ncbi:hypothetical protein B0H14DRAFT_3909846 [Mycena olivaceomarginata]|nr:hypothetical protein B0H14DRAFT_3909846 [Mycena olivaceomarginata]